MVSSSGLSKSLIFKGTQRSETLFFLKNLPSFELSRQPELEVGLHFDHDAGILAQQLLPVVEIKYGKCSPDPAIPSTYHLASLTPYLTAVCAKV